MEDKIKKLITHGFSAFDFNEDYSPKIQVGFSKFKTIIFGEPGKNLQLLLFSTALNELGVLYQYMHKNKISTVKVNGCVEINFDTDIENIEMIKASEIFGAVCGEEYRILVSEIWPRFTSNFTNDCKFKESKKDINADGKIYNLKNKVTLNV